MASEGDPSNLCGGWTIRCMWVIMVKDAAAVIQGSCFRGTWMPFRGDWILLSRQWGNPEGVWMWEEHYQS